MRSSHGMPALSCVALGLVVPPWAVSSSASSNVTLTPPDASYRTFQMELIGTDPVRVIQAADDVTELG